MQKIDQHNRMVKRAGLAVTQTQLKSLINKLLNDLEHIISPMPQFPHL